MSTRKMFSEMDADSRRFYSRIINVAMFNLYAVENKLFDSLICQSDDPHVLERWEEAEPLIFDTLQNRAEGDPNEDSIWGDF